MIEVKRFIEAEFGSAENLRGDLESAGFNPPELDSMQKWGRRNSVPGNWLAAALAIRETQMGAPISVLPYIKGAKLECNHSLSARPTHIGAPSSVFE